MENQFLEAGEIVSTHGVQGEVKIMPWADSPEFLLQFKTFYLDGKAYEVCSSRVHKTCVLAKLRGIDTPEQAVLLRGSHVMIDKTLAELPKGSVFIADLIGCHVLDDGGKEIGILRDVISMPCNDVYVIRGTRSYMIPAVKEFIKEINVTEKTVRVHMIEGFAVDED